MVDLSLLTSDLVISAVLSFVVGMASVTIYSRLKALGGAAGRDYRADEAIVEAVVLEYTRRLRDYDRVIADMRTRIDIMELRTGAHAQTSQVREPVQQGQTHAPAVSEPVAITKHASAPEIEAFEGQNGTTDYILKLLSEKPRTSREVQQAVGRTREHTARLMKKLHDSGFVSRDVNSKPFRYSITDSGQARLREKMEVAAPLEVREQR